MEKEINNLENLKFVSSFVDKNSTKLVESFLEILTEKELQQCKGFTEDTELMADLNNLAIFNKQNFSVTYPTEYVERFISSLNNPECAAPELTNERKVVVFLNFIKKNSINKGKIPRQKIIQKGNVAKEFNIDLETLNEWLAFFGKSYPKQREFTSLEYSEIVRDFVYVEGCESFEKYFTIAYDKSILSEIIGDPTKSSTTNYRNLLKNRIDLEGWDDKDEQFLRWMESHHKMPFSLAYRLISLIIKYNDKMKYKDIKTVFAEYWNRIQ